MADIAAIARVSIPTVSKVLNGRSDVSQRTRERVEQAIRQHGYIRSSAARALRGGHSGLVEVVVHDLASPYIYEVLRGIEDSLQRAGMSLVLSSLHGRNQTTQHWLDGVRARAIDAVVLVLAAGRREQVAELRRVGVPFVLIDSWGQSADDVPSVGATNWGGGFAATEHLIQLGHRRIAMIAGPDELLSSKARVAGFRAALDSNGIAFERSLFRRGDFLAEQGYRQTLALLELEDPPTGIFAGSDLHALGAYRAIRSHNRRVPDDVSVVGFDDLPMAALATPPLSTVRQPLVEMGRMAVDLLLKRLNGEDLDGGSVELPTRLVIRESTTRCVDS